MADNIDKIRSQMAQERTMVDKITQPTSQLNLINKVNEVIDNLDIEVDSSLSTTSENPVQNKVITTALNNKASKSEIPTKLSELTNDEGFITGIDSSDVTTALGYTPYNGTTNPNGYISSVTSGMVTNALGYTPYNGTTNPNGYQANVLEGVQVNGTDQTITNKKVNISVPTNTNQLTNGAGFITSITGSDVTTALGYTPYDSTNPDGYISGIGSSDVITALGYTPYNATNPAGYQANVLESVKVNGTAQTITNKSVNITVPTKTSDLTNDDGFITGITNSDVTTALGYTPYDASNPDGFISDISSTDVTTALGYTPYNSTNPNGYEANAINTIKVNGTAQQITNKAVDIDVPTAVSELTNDEGYITGITSNDVTTALGYTPYDSTNPNGYEANAINTIKVNGTAQSITGKAVDITVPTNNNQLTNGAGYITGIDEDDVTTALGFTPYDAANPDGFISGITSSDVTTALGYTPYNSTNPSGYQANILEGVQVNGVDQTITSKKVNISVPTNTNQLTNGAGFITGIDSADVTNALGFTPYDSANPDGYITSANIGNGTLTIQKNGTNVVTFGANQSGNATANISVPTTAAEVGALADTTTLADLATTAQMSAINSGINATKVGQIASNASDISDIQDLIPTQATSSNQLADKAFVNSTVATNTAYFIGTFNSVAELEAYTGTVTNNDYAFVATTDTAGNTLYDRYKYNADTETWAFEYELNNSSFTAAQWAALNSTATTAKINQIATNTTAITGINNTISGYGNIVTHNVGEFATAAQGARADTALQSGDDVSELNNDAGYITGIDSSDVTTALGFTPYNATNPNGYISGITSAMVTNALGFTPATAAQGAKADTALQSGDDVSELNNDAGYITGIDSSDVTTALGYTPYNSTNPSGYQANVIETVKVNNVAQTVTDKAVNIAVPTNTNQLTNGAGFITGIDDDDVITALGYTPYDSTNPDGYITGITSGDVTTALGYTPYNGTTNPNGYEANAINTIKVNNVTQTITGKAVNIAVPTKTSDLTNDDGFITGITSSDVTTALGYTPYSSANPSGYAANVIETVKVNGTAQTVTGKAVDISVPTNTNQLTNGAGFITGISSSDVTTALGYTPYNGTTNPNGYITGIDSSDVTTALGYTPYNSSNPDGYITGITSSDVTTALGFTPYNATNPNGYITSSAVGNGTITFTQGGVTKGSITMNQSGNATIEFDAGGGSEITVDDELSTSSTNPVENRVITTALNNLQLNAAYDSTTETLSFALTDWTQLMNNLNTIIAGES